MLAGPVPLLLLLPLLLSPSTWAESPHECCRRHQLPSRCVETLCYPSRPPGDFDVYDIFERGRSPRHNDCSRYLDKVGECLAQGRDHSPCCMEEAKDRDESACFGLCRGEGHARQHNTWQHYQTCLAINLPSMFQCFQKGYRDAPTPPRQPTASDIKAVEAVLTWQAPEENAQLVDHYEVALYSMEDGEVDRESEVLLETTETRMPLTSLEPGSKYEARVRAFTAEGAKSLHSTAVHFQTPGISPSVEPFKKLVTVAAKDTQAVLACKFQVSSAQFHTQWLRKAAGAAEFTPLEGARFNSTHYLYSVQRPRRRVMVLEVGELSTAGDMGEYRCVVKDDYGEKSAEVELKMGELAQAKPSPPMTPLECCQSKGVESR